MLSRFVKAAKTQVMPFAAHLYDALKDLLVVPFIPSSCMPPPQPDGTLTRVVIKGALKADDQASLYESLAGLVAVLPPEQKQPAVQKLLEGPIANLMEIFNAPAAKLAQDMQGSANW